MATRTVSVNLVASIGSFVSGMNTAAAATMRLGDTAKASTAKAKSGFDLAGKGALLMGAAVVGGMAAAIGKSMAFEKAMSGAAAATTATGAALGDLRDAAMKAGADTQYSATEAANAITEMGKAGVSTADILDGGLNGALSLAAAGQLDVAKAAEIASVAMTQFSLSGDQLPHVADLLAAGAGKAMGSVEDLGMALNQAGLVASSTGLSIEETTGTLAAFASAGLIGSDAGTSFRSMLQHLQNATGPAQAAMDDLGISMYDSQGNFVGMANLAGQLQTKMKGLTPATRDAAMAQIFGSDAVRAANVLYAQGAAGIADWTSKVNDQGYAAEQAAKLTDNLAGDLERLGGSFDTLMIQLGEGAQGPLRMLVQGFTGLLEVASDVLGFWQSLPGPVQAGVVALAAVAALKGPVGTAMETIALKSLYMKDAVVGAMSGMSGMKAAGAGLLGVFGGPWGLAITGATVGLTALVSWLGQSDEATEAAKSATEGYAAALEGASGALDKNVRAAAAKAAQDAGLLDVAEDAGISLRTVTDAITQQGGALEDVRAKLEAYIVANTILMQTENGPVKHMNDEARAAKEALAALDLLSGQAPKTAAAQSQLASATQGATSSTDQFTAATEAAKSEVDDAKTAVDQFKLSLDILTGAHVSMIQVESAFEAAVADATGAMKDLNGSVLDGSGKLNMQSEAGRKAADVLLDVRDSGNQLISTMIQQGATADQVRAKDASLRASFIASAKQMGISEAAALDLADQILGIPASRNTAITADTAAANSKIAATQRAIDGMHGRDLEIRLRAAGRFVVTPNGGLQEFAEGGYTGRGGKYTPAGIVHAGEFVVPQHRVDALGGPGVVGSLVGMPGYADGGPVLPVNLNFNDSHLLSGMKSVASAMQNVARAPSGGATAGSGALVNFGHWLQSMGARVSEHPAFGGVSYGAHVPGSKHYSGRAIDVNTRAGTSALEQRELDPLMAAARAAGFQVIWRAAGHFNHGHVASYKTGTPFVPQDGLAYLHQGERVVPREQNLRSREFSGGGGRRGGGSVTIAPPAVTVYAQFGDEIIEAKATRIVVGALTGVHDRTAY